MNASRAPLVLAAVGCVAIFAPTLVPPHPRLIWNASASAAVGFYFVSRPRALDVADLVVVRPPAPLASWLAGRHYLPAGVPLLKHVAALGGQQVCRFGARVSVDGVVTAWAMHHDRLGRPLPTWTGCVTLRADQVFLLNTQRPDSLDSRYFGPIPRVDIMGKAHPIWTPGDIR